MKRIISQRKEEFKRYFYQVELGEKKVSDVVRIMGISSEGYYKKIRELKSAIDGILARGKTGRKPKGYIKDIDKANKEISSLKEELRDRDIIISTLRKAVVLKDTLLWMLTFLLSLISEKLKLDVGLKYRRFGKEAKVKILEFMRVFLELGGTKKEFSEFIGKSLRSILNWEKKEKEGDLEDKSSRPLSSPSLLPLWIVRVIKKIKERFPHWSARQISFYMGRLKWAHLHVSASTVAKVLRGEYDGVVPSEYHRRRNKRPPKDRKKLHTFLVPNMTWCADFFHVVVDEVKYYGFIIIDEASRYVLGIKIMKETSTRAVLRFIRGLILSYGAPLIFKTDNGPEFREEFSRGIGRMGLYHLPSPRWYAPFNGKIGRAIGKIRVYLRATGEIVEDKIEGFLREWRWEVNYLSYNEALGGLTPEDIYLKGERYELPSSTEVISVKMVDGEVVLRFTDRNGKKAKATMEKVIA
ncbi:MAG: transposase family protein [Nitrospinae bacterium]|nr:transposase family protein [Nitrospinota bacterium]